MKMMEKYRQSGSIICKSKMKSMSNLNEGNTFKGPQIVKHFVCSGQHSYQWLKRYSCNDIQSVNSAPSIAILVSSTCQVIKTWTLYAVSGIISIWNIHKMPQTKQKIDGVQTLVKVNRLIMKVTCKCLQ